MIEIARKFLMGLAVAGMLGCPKPHPPIPTPTPNPTPTPVTYKYLDLLLRSPNPPFLERGGQPFTPFGAVPCCASTYVGGVEIDVEWSWASKSWQDYTRQFGVNMYHFRMGPMYTCGSPQSPPDCLDPGMAMSQYGGPFVGGPGSDWNAPFWNHIVDLIDYAGQHGANVEIVPIDTWFCKHAASNWGDITMPWPQEDIDACGKEMTPEQEKYVRKVVAETACFGNVIYITDNEGGEIRGTKRQWYEAVHAIIRDEEAKSVCNIAHMIGTNNTDFADGPFDYVATHAKSALTEPIAGKHTENNERNPAFSAEEEYANFCKARKAGLHWWFWRAEMPFEDSEWLLNKIKEDNCGSPVGCFAPSEDDPKWEYYGDNASHQAYMRPPILEVEQVVGSRCGAMVNGSIFDGALQTIEMLASELRKRGYCASRGADALTVKNPEGLWEEHHSVAFNTGCYTTNPLLNPKAFYKYTGDNPSPGGCPDGVTDEIRCKLHQPTNFIYDCTPLNNGKPILPEGDPNRSFCEKQACGGVPSFDMQSQSLTLVPKENPYQFKLTGSGSGILHCTCPSSGSTDICYSKAITQ